MEFELSSFKSKTRCCENAALNMPANLENAAVATDWKRSVFIPIPKNGNAKERSNYHTITLISWASKVMLKILQARPQQYVNCELPDVQARKRNQKSNCQHTLDHRKSKKSSRKISALLTMPQPLTVWITKNYGKFLKRCAYWSLVKLL